LAVKVFMKNDSPPSERRSPFIPLPLVLVAMSIVGDAFTARCRAIGGQW
jgi:hypothetical protein